ncbi:hypothetical protein [Halovivax limisalsi]|uniref:hypothetical protein n=1 Tax=Halovivax limisalsi TaxID=1453760 RepID=UPI001FFC3D4C|nr:hypothetical protein [Halovivax limisalsi]
MESGKDEAVDNWPWGQYERLTGIEIAYEDDHLETEHIPLTRDYESRGPEAISYRPSTGHWYVERRQETASGDEICPTLVPRERVYVVIGYLRYSTLEAQREFGDSEFERVRYDDGIEFRELPNENEELLTPITFHPSTEHWQCVVRDLKNLENRQPIVTHRILPRESVVWVT